MDAIAQLADELSGVLGQVPTDGGSYGMIHGDLHLGNVHFDGDVPTIFDMDHCGHGWRAYDLAPIRMAFDDPTWDAFVRAYRERRELPPGIEHIDDFARMRVLWDVGDLLAMQATWGNTKISDQLRQQLPKLAAHLGLSPDTAAPAG